jgi:hypothetical protein
MTRQLANIQTHYVYPSAGVRGIISLFICSYMEEISGRTMYELSDSNTGFSIGCLPAAAFSLNNPDRSLKAIDILWNMVETSHAIFARDPAEMLAFNILYDALQIFDHDPDQIPKNAKHFFKKTFMGKKILRMAKKHKPDKSDTHYDTKLLENSLKNKFDGLCMSDLEKPCFMIAHAINASEPHLFSNIRALDVWKQNATSFQLNDYTIHDTISIVEAIMAATAIPGLMGYRHVKHLNEAYMDVGPLSFPILPLIMADLHKIAHAQNGKKQSVTSRLIYIGVGDENSKVYDTSNTLGLARTGDYFAASTQHVTKLSFSPIHKQFNALSEKIAQAPAVRMIDSSIFPRNDHEKDFFPSISVTDGRAKNIRRLLEFSALVARKNSEIIRFEIALRMKTLRARGVLSEREMNETLERLQSTDPEFVIKKILVPPDHIQKLLDPEKDNTKKQDKKPKSFVF